MRLVFQSLGLEHLSIGLGFSVVYFGHKISVNMLMFTNHKDSIAWHISEVAEASALQSTQ